MWPRTWYGILLNSPIRYDLIAAPLADWEISPPTEHLRRGNQWLSPPISSAINLPLYRTEGAALLLVRDCLFVVPKYAYFAAGLHILEVVYLSATWDAGGSRQLYNRFHHTLRFNIGRWKMKINVCNVHMQALHRKLDVVLVQTLPCNCSETD